MSRKADTRVAQQPKVFVSHSHKDDDFTQRLVNDLHRAGAEVWVDTSGITRGNFMQRIDEALQQCHWMVVVLTPNAIASSYVQEEVYTALHRVHQGYMSDVIPVLAAPCMPGTIPPQWDTRHRYDATQDYDSALEGLLRAVGLPQTTAIVRPADSVSTLLARGKALIEQSNYIEALRLFESATQLAPGSFDAWVELALALNVVGRWQEALAAGERAIVINPTRALAWSSKALSLNKLNRYDEARIAYDEALTLAPYYDSTWLGMASVLRALGDVVQAGEVEQRAMELDGAEQDWTRREATLIGNYVYFPYFP